MLTRIVVVIAAFLISMPILSFGLGLISAKDDMAVAFGFLIVGVLAIAWFLGISRFARFTWKEASKYRALLALCLLVFLGACTTIEPGHVGIKINAYGANKGVNDYPAVTGRVTYNPISTSVISYPVFVQNVSWTKDPGEGHPSNEEISFNTGDQMVVYADVSLAYQLDQSKAPAFYVKFRADDIDKWTHGFLRNLTRQKFDEIAGKYKIEQIMGDNAPFLAEVRKAVQTELDPYGVHLEQLGFNGSPRPPQAVIDSINGKVKATQDAIRVENELRQSKAQAEKDVTRAEGEARANQIITSSITPNLLEWRRLEIQSMTGLKWDGRLPTYSGSNVPMIQLPQPRN